MYSLAIALTVMLNLALGAYIFFQGPKIKANRFYAYTIFGLVVWGMGFFMMQLGTSTDGYAFAGSRIAAIGYIFVPVFFLYFMFAFTRNESMMSSWMIFSSVFFLAFLFTYLTWTSDVVIFGVEAIARGHRALVGPLFVWLMLYLALLMGVALYLCWKFMIHATSHRESRRALFVLFATGGSILLGFISEFALLRTGIISFPIGYFFTALNAAVVSYAIVRYRFLSVTDVLNLEQVFAAMDDAIVIVDDRLRILKTNQAFLDWLGYSEDFIIERILPEYLKGVDNVMEFVLGKSKKHVKLYFLTHHGKKIPVNLNTSLVKDRDGSVIGAVLVARDLRDRRLLDELRTVKQSLVSRLHQLEEYQQRSL